MKKIYLATPYTGTPEQQNERFRQACRLSAEVIRQGHCVFSPIAHSHFISRLGSIDGSHDSWKDQNETWLEWADEIWVAKMAGIEESQGVQWEIKWAFDHGKRVVFMDLPK